MEKSYLALVTEEIGENIFQRSIKELKIADLPENDVLIKVHYSALNYKDALTARGHKGITRKYPHTPGIDAAGEVVESKSEAFNFGDRIVVTGYDLGMNTAGGFGGYIRVPVEWIVKLSQDMTYKEAMILGTAGFTAGISLFELQAHNIMPETGKILVTGATGGVGSLAVAILSKAGYDVCASTGKKEFFDWLYELGANEVIGRDEVINNSTKPLLSKKWFACIETVGGSTLEFAIRSMEHRGVVCTLGNVAGDNFSTTVYPFILRGLKLIGIDSATRPMNERQYVWNKLFDEWKPINLEKLAREISIYELDDEINKILNGKQVGRVIIKH